MGFIHLVTMYRNILFGLQVQSFVFLHVLSIVSATASSDIGSSSTCIDYL